MPIILDPRDCGEAASIEVLTYPHPSGNSCAIRRFVAYTLRRVEPLNQLVLCEDLGDRLGPPLGEFPGPKEGAASLQAEKDAIIVYYTGRAPGDDLGPFQLQKQTVPVPGIWPMPEAALQRVRNLARLLVKHFPDLAGDLALYVK